MADMYKQFAVPLNITRELVGYSTGMELASSLTDDEMDSIANAMAKSLEQWNADSYDNSLTACIDYVLEQRK